VKNDNRLCVRQNTCLPKAQREFRVPVNRTIPGQAAQCTLQQTNSAPQSTIGEDFSLSHA